MTKDLCSRCGGVIASVEQACVTPGATTNVLVYLHLPMPHMIISATVVIIVPNTHSRTYLENIDRCQQYSGGIQCHIALPKHNCCISACQVYF